MMLKRATAQLPFWAIVACGLDAALGFPLHPNVLLHVSAFSATHTLAPMLFTTVLPLAIWLGLGIRAGMLQYVRTRRALRPLLAVPRQPLPPTLRSIATDLALRDRLDLVGCSPPHIFCYGLIRPRIYLTTGLLARLSHAEIDAVLRHERVHLVRRDPLRTLGWTMLDGACWWLDGGSARARHDRELAADRAVIVDGKRQELAQALFKLLTTFPDRGNALATLAVSAFSIVNARIDQLLDPDQIVPPTVAARHRLRLPALTGAAALVCVAIMLHAGT